MQSPLNPDLDYYFSCPHQKNLYQLDKIDMVFAKELPIVYFMIKYVFKKTQVRFLKKKHRTKPPSDIVQFYKMVFEDGKLKPLPEQEDYEIFDSRNKSHLYTEYRALVQSGLVTRSRDLPDLFAFGSSYYEGWNPNSILEVEGWFLSTYQIKIDLTASNSLQELHGFMDMVKNTFLEYIDLLCQKYPETDYQKLDAMIGDDLHG
jgi:hypothetical protein